MVITRKMCCEQNGPSLAKIRAARKRWEKKGLNKQTQIEAKKQAEEQAGMMRKARLVKQANQQRLKAESRAELSAKRQHAVASRWNKFSAKKDQRIEAVGNTAKTLSVRKCQSTQVDFTSPVIAELRHSLTMKDEQRLTKSDRKRPQTLPRKPLHEVKRSAFLPRIRKIEDLILGSKRKSLSYEEFHQTSESVRHQLQIPSPEKKGCEHANTSFLVEDEISDFESKTDQFFKCIRENFPQSSISPKGHYLRSHVGQFMRRHGFWGLLSEQSIEALHAKVNKDERRLACLRNRMKIQQKSFKAHICVIICMMLHYSVLMSRI